MLKGNQCVYWFNPVCICLPLSAPRLNACCVASDVISLCETKRYAVLNLNWSQRISYSLHADKEISLIHALGKKELFFPGSSSQDFSLLFLFSFFSLLDTCFLFYTLFFRFRCLNLKYLQNFGSQTPVFSQLYRLINHSTHFLR